MNKDAKMVKPMARKNNPTEKGVMENVIKESNAKMIFDKDTGKLYIGRAFSIASEPNSEEMEFYVVKEHGGHVSYFTTSKPGDNG